MEENKYSEVNKKSNGFYTLLCHVFIKVQIYKELHKHKEILQKKLIRQKRNFFLSKRFYVLLRRLESKVVGKGTVYFLYTPELSGSECLYRYIRRAIRKGYKVRIM